MSRERVFLLRVVTGILALGMVAIAIWADAWLVRWFLGFCALTLMYFVFAFFSNG